MIFVPVKYLLGSALGFYFLRILTNDLFMLSEIVFNRISLDNLILGQ